MWPALSKEYIPKSMIPKSDYLSRAILVSARTPLEISGRELRVRDVVLSSVSPDV